MGDWTAFFRRLAHFRGRTQFDRELQAELESHLEARADDLVDEGLTRDAALAQARREFGSPLRARESAEAAWQFRWLEDLAADIRYALRALRRSPAFTLTAVASLALGIGAASAMFAALDAVLWKPLPVTDPARLARISLTRAAAEETQQIPREYLEQLRQSGIFADLILTSEDGLSFTYDDRAERIVGASVSTNYFSALGVQPVLGRGFSASAPGSGWPAEAVLSYRFWQRRFGGDPAVIGRTIHLNTYPFTIVGVSPASFFDLERGFEPELRIPLLPVGETLSQIDQISGALDRRLNATARLSASTTAPQAESAADAQLRLWLQSTTLPSARRQQYGHARLLPAEAGWSGELASFRSPMYVLLALVALVLLIACANVANMLLARGVARSRELALRASIGAGRSRLVRQLLTESVVLASAGGAVGIAIAYGASGALTWFLPQGHIALVVDVHPDVRVVAFTAALSMLTGIVFGLAPALNASRRDLATGLKADVAGGHSVARRTLVQAQVALSLVLLVVAGWFVRTVANLRPVDFRVPVDRVLLVTMKPQREIYDANRMRALVTELDRRMHTLPGVQAAAFAEFGPLGSRRDELTFESSPSTQAHGAIDLVTPGFFETLGMPLVAGRDIDRTDVVGAPLTAVLNESMARTLFPGVNAIGQTFRLARDPEHRVFTVVGIVASAHYYDLHAPAPAAWIALLQQTPYMPTLHVRAADTDLAPVMAGVRHEFDAVDKGFPIFNIRTLESRVEDSLARERMVANISAAFGVAALLLAGVGLYGVLAYFVSRRQREIGIRRALGSSAGGVLRLVTREAAVLVAGGVAAGFAIAAVARQLAGPYLYGVPRFDLVVFAASAAGLLAIAIVAVSVPAARAARVDPLQALRVE